MRKTLGDMAKHIKSIILPETLEAYSINPMFEGVSHEESIREGIFAFRAFLLRFCDVLIAEGDLYDKPKKAADEHLSAIYYNFPFLDNVKKLLLSIGVNGILTEDAGALIAGNDIFNTKLSTVKNIECLQFLTTCGMRFDGIDLNAKRQKLSEIEALVISYPDNPAMLIGLKVMAIAEKELGTNLSHNVLMRCDYRVLSDGKIDALSALKETIEPLSANIQDFVLRLHQLHLDKGLNCTVEVRGFWKKVKYSRGRKEVWGINTSLNCGYELTVKAQNTHKYADVIMGFPMALQELIAKGYGCGRKRSGIGKCDAGCEGLRIPLDDSVLDISDGIEIWLGQELSGLRRRTS